MQPNIQVSQPTIYNRFHDCAFIALVLGKNNGRIEAVFTIVFGEHVESNTAIGEVRFGIRRGELKVDVENGHIAPAEIDFMKEFSFITEVNAAEEKTGASSNTVKLMSSAKGKLGIEPSLASQLEAGAEATLQAETKRSRSFRSSVYHVRAHWHPRRPRWEFHTQLWEFYLEGLIDKRRFAVITMTASPLKFRYKFDIRPKDIVYTNVNFLTNVKSINKNKILHVLLTKMIFGEQKILSSGEARYG